MTLEAVKQQSHTHKWDRDHARGLDGSSFNDGNARTERDCILCGMVKITVHGGDGTAWREWRTFDGKSWWGSATPPCNDRVTA